MSGTSSYIILEKEDGFHSIKATHDLLLYLYLIHNNRNDWANCCS